MAIITLPAEPAPQRVVFDPDQPTLFNRSWTGKRRGVILPQAHRWNFQAAWPRIRGADFYPWRAFLMQLRGAANSFRLVVDHKQRLTGITPRVNGAGQGGYSLVTDGWGDDGRKLEAGQFVTVNDQLLVLTAPVDAVSGAATIQFEPYLRLSPADNALVIVDRPTALVALADGKRTWTIEPGQINAFALNLEEDF